MRGLSKCYLRGNQRGIKMSLVLTCVYSTEGYNISTMSTHCTTRLFRFIIIWQSQHGIYLFSVFNILSFFKKRLVILIWCECFNSKIYCWNYLNDWNCNSLMCGVHLIGGSKSKLKLAPILVGMKHFFLWFELIIHLLLTHHT